MDDQKIQDKDAQAIQAAIVFTTFDQIILSREIRIHQLFS